MERIVTTPADKKIYHSADEKVAVFREVKGKKTKQVIMLADAKIGESVYDKDTNKLIGNCNSDFDKEEFTHLYFGQI